MNDLSGQNIGRYNLIARLGEGGMATVYKAHDIRLDRDVAIKIIRQGAFPSDLLQDILTRFEREAKALARLSHPHIVKVYDYGEHMGSPYLVMEYLPGGTLKRMLGKPLPWQNAVRLILPVMRGVAYAHDHGILHRDIKPANILITDRGEPMLSDFGIAKLFEKDRGDEITTTGTAIGTPEYMAPEQWAGQAIFASDQYSLGVVLYEMIAGRKPYQADTPAAILLKQATEPVPMPSKFVPSIPALLETILIRMLEKEPVNRYTDLTEAALALEELQAITPSHRTALLQQPPLPPTGHSGATLPPTPTPTPATGPSAQKPWLNLWNVLIAFGLLFVCGCIILAAWITPRLLTPPAPPTQTPLSILPFPSATLSATPEIILPTFTSALDTPTAVASNQGWIAYVSRINGNDDIYIIKPDGGDPIQITSDPAHEQNPDWSPDGYYLTYQTNKGGSDMDLMIINIRTQETRKLTNDDCDQWAPSWSPDSRWIVYYSNCGSLKNVREIYKIGIVGGIPMQLTATNSQYNWYPTWSPDGKKIAFSSNRTGKYGIYTMNNDGTNEQRLTDGCSPRYSPDGKQILYSIFCTDTGPIWLMDANGRNQRPLIENRECRNAAWSPDGKRIVFQDLNLQNTKQYSLLILELAHPEEEHWFKLLDYDISASNPAWGNSNFQP